MNLQNNTIEQPAPQEQPDALSMYREKMTPETYTVLEKRYRTASLLYRKFKRDHPDFLQLDVAPPEDGDIEYSQYVQLLRMIKTSIDEQLKAYPNLQKGHTHGQLYGFRYDVGMQILKDYLHDNLKNDPEVQLSDEQWGKIDEALGPVFFLPAEGDIPKLRKEYKSILDSRRKEIFVDTKAIPVSLARVVEKKILTYTHGLAESNKALIAFRRRLVDEDQEHWQEFMQALPQNDEALSDIMGTWRGQHTEGNQPRLQKFTDTIEPTNDAMANIAANWEMGMDMVGVGPMGTLPDEDVQPTVPQSKGDQQREQPTV